MTQDEFDRLETGDHVWWKGLGGGVEFLCARCSRVSALAVTLHWLGVPGARDATWTFAQLHTYEVYSGTEMVFIDIGVL